MSRRLGDCGRHADNWPRLADPCARHRVGRTARQRNRSHGERQPRPDVTRGTLTATFWIVVVVLLPLVGSILWWAVGREYDSRRDQPVGFGDPRRTEALERRLAERSMSSTEAELARLEAEIAHAETETRIRRLEAEFRARSTDPGPAGPS